MNNENGDILITLIAIVLAALLMFFVPLMAVSNNQEDVSQLAAQSATQEFVDKVSTKGVITQEDYDAFVQTLNSTGNTFDVKIEVQHLDENPGKKVSVTSGDLIGENLRYSDLTQVILEAMADDANGKYRLKKGDNIIVTVNNTNTTLAQLFRNFAYKMTGKDTSQIKAIASAMVGSNGQ